MTNVLFWNLNKRVDEATIVAIVDSTRADVIGLAEANHVDDAELEFQLFLKTRREYTRVKLAFRIKIFVALPCKMNVRKEMGYMIVVEMQQALGPDLLVGFVHLPSKLNGAPEMVARKIPAEIEDFERQANHKRTILIGDFNMDPYELGMCAPDSLNAVTCQQIANRNNRTVYEKQYAFFYNPMWNLLGDKTPGPPGSFYFRTPKDSIYWRMLDQILLRPEAIKYVDLQSIEILRELPNLKLADSNGRPNQSDHFPIFFATRNIL